MRAALFPTTRPEYRYYSRGCALLRSRSGPCQTCATGTRRSPCTRPNPFG